MYKTGNFYIGMNHVKSSSQSQSRTIMLNKFMEAKVLAIRMWRKTVRERERDRY